MIEGRHKVVLLVMRSLLGKDNVIPPIISAEIRDFKSANVLGLALQKTPDAESEDALPYETVDQSAIGMLIG